MRTHELIDTDISFSEPHGMKPPKLRLRRGRARTLPQADDPLLPAAHPEPPAEGPPAPEATTPPPPLPPLPPGDDDAAPRGDRDARTAA